MKVVQRIPVRIDIDPNQNSDHQPTAWHVSGAQSVCPVATTYFRRQTPHPGEPWRPKYNPWLIAVVVAMAAFMEVLDTSIANVALPYMAGGLGASNDESTWVLTSYLVSNAVVLPISGWLAGLFGRKRFFLICIFLFTLSSLALRHRPQPGPADFFPGSAGRRRRRAAAHGSSDPRRYVSSGETRLAFALYGITAIMAPTIGPTLGGWITDNYSWRWIFFINLPVGVLATVSGHSPGGRSAVPAARLRAGACASTILAYRCWLWAWARFRWCSTRDRKTIGSAPASSPTSSSSRPSVWLSLVIWEWRHKAPIIDVRLFKNFNFATANIMMFSFRRSAFQQPGDDAAVSADRDGIHGAKMPGWFFRAADWSC